MSELWRERIVLPEVVVDPVEGRYSWCNGQQSGVVRVWMRALWTDEGLQKAFFVQFISRGWLFSVIFLENSKTRDRDLSTTDEDAIFSARRRLAFSYMR